MFAEDFKRLALLNNNFRKVLYAGQYSQIVAMSIPSGGEIGEEVHPATDQQFFILRGGGEAVVGGEHHVFTENGFIFVPAGTKHNILCTSNEDLKLLTVYAPPVHAKDEVQEKK